MNPVLKSVAIHLLLLIAASATLLLGILTPFYFRGVAPALIRAAGHGTPSLASQASELTRFGKISPVLEFARIPGGITLDDDLVVLVQENPIFFFSGGSAPYIEEIVRRLDIDPVSRINPTTIVELLTPRTHRSYVRDFLSRTRNANVRAVLSTLDLKGTLLLQPVSSAAGGPLEIAILTTALLIQGDEIPREISAEIAMWCQRAMQGELQALERIEAFYLSMLSLGKRFQWVSMAELIRIMPNQFAIERTATLFRLYPESRPLLYSAILLSGDPDRLIDFIEQYGDPGKDDVQTALLAGQGGLKLLLARFSPIYRPYAWNRHLDRLQQLILKTPLFKIALKHPVWAGFLKAIFLMLSGWALVVWIRHIIGDPEHMPAGNYTLPLAQAGNLSVAAAWSACVWLSLEPEFLQQIQHSPPPPRSLTIVVASAFENLKSDVMNSIAIDQVTLIVLGLFFLLQVSIYAYSRVKLQDIKKLDAPADIKIRLIENEEHLFDSGLYVGLSGTVGSLIMLAMNIVQASLMAAYASTLFGIIFVAILKIFHIRPYRNSLILDLVSATPKTAAQERTLRLK